MEKMRPGEGTRQNVHEIPAEMQGPITNWNCGTVPGDVYTDLHRAGELEDPYFGRNMQKAKWAQEYEWWYVRQFNLPEGMEGKEIRLAFEGVDYGCEVWLNGQRLGDHEGMFSAFAFDVTELVEHENWKRGSNMLMVKLNPPPKNYRNVAGGKPNWSGDYFTGITPFGIWRPVLIEATGSVRVDDVRTASAVEGDDAVLTVDTELHNHADTERTVRLEYALEGENFDSERYDGAVEVDVQPGSNAATAEIHVPDADLWWPWDMGEQHLYELDVRLVRDDAVLDSVTEVVGIREVEMATNPGLADDEVDNPWTFVINGEETFLRSACWGGQPSFLYGRNSDEKYEELLAMARDCNINNLRIFGWHPPEIPKFYELCDRLGITVWTNFPFATQVFRDDDAFVDAAVEECLGVVEQRDNHPSNVFWMGGEEVFFTQAHAESNNRNLMETIGENVTEYTADPYGLASPMGDEIGQRMGFKPMEPKHANAHYYSGGRLFMEEYYPSLETAIVPELTAASAPSVESLRKFIPEDELWPMGLSWGYHWADIDNLKGLNIEVFGDTRTESLEEFVEATQVAQGRIFQFALEEYRRRKPRTSGVALCHFITNWPDIKWGIVDYYREQKRSYDYVKRSYQPLLPSLKFTRRRWKPGETFEADLWIVNDLHERYPAATLRWEISDDEAVVASGSLTTSVDPNSARDVGDVAWTLPQEIDGEFAVELELLADDGETMSSNRYTLLVGDQKEAKRRAEKHAEESRERIEEHGRHYHRYFPDQWEVE